MRKFWDFIGIIRDVISLKISEIFKEAVNIIPTKQNMLSIIASTFLFKRYKQRNFMYERKSRNRNTEK